MENQLTSYLISLRAYPLLTAAEEKELYVKIHDTSLDEDERQEARDTLVTSNLRLVVNIAKNYRNNYLSFMDLIQEGNNGLLKAVDNFDPSKGRFSTCASLWIKQAILKAIMDNGKLVRVPAHMFQLQAKLRKTENALAAKQGINPSNEALAAALNTNLDKVELAKRNMGGIVSLDKKLDSSTSDANADTLADLIEDKDAPLPSTIAIHNDEIERMHLELSKLPERTQKIMKLRYGVGKPGELIEGLPADAPHTLDEVGEALKLTRERIRQIEKQTLQTLRARLSQYVHMSKTKIFCWNLSKID